MAPLLPGDPCQLGEYWLAGRLGVGGQGVVYDAYDEAGQRVAVKVLRAEYLEHHAMRDDFAKEVVAARRVAAFCTARVIDARLDGPRPYIVSEYIDGPSLRQAVEHAGPYGFARLHRLAIGIATALTAIHHAGVVHRDLKPANVLLGPDGPRVIDFGIARTEEMTLTTEGGVAVGTPAYMAPERLVGQRGGPAMDVWAWGAVMLYAATGRPPFAGDGDGGAAGVALTQYRILTTRPDFTVLQEPLRHLVSAAMARDPSARPSAQALLIGLIGGRDDVPRLLLSGSEAAKAVRLPAGLARPSLAEVAEGVYDRLSPDDQALVPTILLRMVVSDETAESALREASRSDLLDGAADPSQVDRVLRAFGDRGLVVQRGESVTLVNAALLRAWPRLLEWIDTDREGLRIHTALNRAAGLWETNGRKPDDLFQGTVLEETLDWVARERRHIEPNPLERAFLDASTTRTRAQARRRRQIVGTIATLVAVLLASVGVVVVQNALGSRQRDAAAAKQAAARANALRAEEPPTAMLLSVAAWRLAPVTEAKAAMQGSLAQRERAVFRPRPLTGDAVHDLSTDGRTLVVVDQGRATLWDVATRRRTGVIEGVAGPVAAVALSADGRRLAVAGDRRIGLWDTERTLRIAEFGEGARWLAFSPRRLLLAAVTRQGRGRVWDLTNQTRLPLDVPGVGDISFSTDDGLMAATVPGGRYELWNWQGRLARLPGEVIAFSPDGRTAAVGTGGGVRFRDLATGRWRAVTLKGVRARSLRYGRDGDFLAVYDGARIALWSRDGTRLLSHPVTGVVRELRLDQAAGRLGYSLIDGTAVTLDVADLTRPRKLAGSADAALFDPAAHTAIVYGSRVELWDVPAGKRLVRFPASLSKATAMALGPRGDVLAVGTAYPAAVTLWDVRTASKGRAFPIGDATEVGGLAFSPDGGTLAVAPFRDTVTPPAKNWRNVQLWDVRRGVRARTLPVAGGSGMAFRPDGRELAVDGEDHALVDVRTGRVAGKPFGATVDGVRAIAFSPDSRIVATGALAAGVSLWDAVSHRLLARLTPQGKEFEEVNLLAFAPGGRTLAVGGARSVQLWDVADRAPLGPPFAYEAGGLAALAFTADGRDLYSLRTDGTVGVHPVDPARVAAAVCARAGLTLSAADWNRLVPSSPYREVC